MVMKYHGKYYSTDYNHNSKLNHILKKMILSSLRMILFFFSQAPSSTVVRMPISRNSARYHCSGSCVVTRFLANKNFKILPLNTENKPVSPQSPKQICWVWGSAKG